MSINEHIICITNLGEFESLQSVWDTYPEGGKEGDYIYLGGDLYCWDKYSRSWVVCVDIESSQVKPINVTYAEGVVGYSDDYINYLGNFESIEQVWNTFPNGGKEGDYILVAGERYRWNKYTSNWGEVDSSDITPARPIVTLYGDLHVFNDAVIGEDLYARILNTYTTKKWILDQGYVSLNDVTSEVVMNRILLDWKTVGKNEKGELYVIGGSSGGGVVGGVTIDEVKNFLLLDKYTTQGWIEEQGFLKADRDQVIAALGYTPLANNDTATNSFKLNGIGLIDGTGRNGIPVSSETGYMEVGKALDFHLDTSNIDYSTRLCVAANNRNIVYLPTTNGTLALVSDITNALASYVTIGSAQDITGIKNFINGFKIGGKSVTYNAEKNALVFPLNAIFEGEVAWNSTLEGFDVPTIMDAIQVDGVHIKKDKGYLEFVGEVGGGIDESQLGDYLTRNNYAKKSDIPSLSGYATEIWVTGKGYITGINGSMVIAALGYTPYNSANFTKATIKSTLGISDWALASVKPSYSWSEIGSRPTALSQFSNDSGFITNNVTGDFSASGMVRGNYLSTGYIQISSNIDASLRTSIFGDAGNHWGQIKAFRTGGSASYGSLAGGYAAGILFAMNDRHGFIQLPEAASKAGEAVIGGGTGENIEWSAKLLHSLNYSSYALPITGGTINGSLTVTASVTAPTFVGSLSGIADNSTQLNGLGANYYVKSPSSYDFASFNSGLKSNAIYEYRAGDGLSYAGDPVGSGYGALMNIRDYRGNDGFQFLSTAASAWNKTDYRLLYRGKARSTSIDMSNGWREIPLMDMSGNLVVKGEVTWNSSRVLKNIVNDEPTYLSMEDMLKIKPYRYTWKDGRDDKVHAGGIADEVLEVLPEVIITDSEGIHSMDYGQASFTVATSLTPHVNRHNEEIDALKRRVKELEDLVTKLLNKYGDL